jgi:hypothetical protein
MKLDEKPTKPAFINIQFLQKDEGETLIKKKNS